MRTVKITIEVEVPDDCDRVAVNNFGNPVGFSVDSDPCCKISSLEWMLGIGYSRGLYVKNWKETLTKVDDYAAGDHELYGRKHEKMP